MVALWGAGQTINIMTLGGLALAVGILVDEATVAIENIHTHLARGDAGRRGRCWTRSGEVVVPRLLAMLSVVAVFVPSFFMTGVSRSLFVPLSLAVGFAMIASFLLSSSLVPVLSVWLLGEAVDRRRRAEPHADDWVERLRESPRTRCCSGWRRRAWLLVAGYVVVTVGDRRRRRSHARPRDLPAERRQGSSSCGSARRPARSSSRPSGWRATCSTRSAQAAGPDNVEITLGYVGVQPSSYPINTIFLWTGGSHEGVLQVALKPDAPHAPRGLRGRRCAGASASSFPTRSSRSSRATSSAGS